MNLCEYCNQNRAILLRSESQKKACKICFFENFENDIHNTIISTNMFGVNTNTDSVKVGIGISGGKDSTVLAHVLNELNIKYNYNLELILLCVDEGIDGYRDQSIQSVHFNKELLKMNLKIISYEEIFNTTMDKLIKGDPKNTNECCKNNNFISPPSINVNSSCTYCGVFRRQALEEAARTMKVDYIVTGHNADDMAETVILNLIRGDIGRLGRCTDSQTKPDNLSLSRCKPFKYTHQKEIVLYAYYKKLSYFSTECPYSPTASRGDTRTLIKNLEKIDPKIIIKIINSGDQIKTNIKGGDSKCVKKCEKCNHPTSGSICIACTLLEKIRRI